MDNGEMFIGANQENAAFAGICGERAALYAAGAKYPGIPVKTVAITSFTRGDFVEEPTAPCGVCRQAFLEFEKNGHAIELILAGKEKIYILDSFHGTMPLSFTEF
jgi:cytidine deaminase